MSVVYCFLLGLGCLTLLLLVAGEGCLLMMWLMIVCVECVVLLLCHVALVVGQSW